MKPLTVVLAITLIYLRRGLTEKIATQNISSTVAPNETLVTAMVDTDRYIVEILLEPMEEQNGIELLRMVTWYIHLLSEVTHRVLDLAVFDERSSELWDIHESLQSTDGPRFLKVIPVYDLYVSKFKWSKYSLDNLKSSLESAKTYWEKLQQIVRSKRISCDSKNTVA